MSNITELLAYKLNKDENSYSILTCVSEDELPVDVELPTEYNGLPVTGICDYALCGFKQVENLYIPESIVYIGEDILIDCDNIERVTASPDILRQLDVYMDEDISLVDYEGDEIERLNWLGIEDDDYELE